MPPPRKDSTPITTSPGLSAVRDENDALRALKYVLSETGSFISTSQVPETSDTLRVVRSLRVLLENVSIGVTNPELSRNFSQITEILMGLEEAHKDALEGAQNQAIEFANENEELRRKQKTTSGEKIPEDKVRAKIKELARKKEHLGREQEVFEDRRAEAEAELKVLQMKIITAGKNEKRGLEVEAEGVLKQIGFLERMVQEKLDAGEKLETEIKIRKAYLAAADLVEKTSAEYMI